MKTIEAHVLIEFEGPNLDIDYLKSELLNAVDSVLFGTSVEINHVSVDFDVDGMTEGGYTPLMEDDSDVPF